MIIHASWHPITDFELDPEALLDRALGSLAAVWEEQCDRLSQGQALAEFCRRLQREWAIETGILERLYDLDRGVTRLLIERGIDADLIAHGGNGGNPHRAARLIADQLDVVEGIMDSVGRERALTVGYIKELHAALTRSQETTEASDQFGRVFEVELRKGEYKTLPNNPTRADGTVHEYCPPEQVTSEMDRLIEMHAAHGAAGVSPEVEAAWLHHRFVQIHPFQDGNGRVARTLASIALVRGGWFPLVVNRDHRSDYLNALESADDADLRPLVGLFADVQRRAFVQALSLSEEVLRPSALDDLLAATVQKVERRAEERLVEQGGALDVAAALHQRAHQAIAGIAARYENRLGPILKNARFFVHESMIEDPERAHWFRAEIIDLAKGFGYFASFRSGSSWVRLMVDTDSRAEIVVSFHGVGRQFTGVMVATAFWHLRQREDGGYGPPSGPWEVAEPFELTYLDDAAGIGARFDAWLAEALLEALRQWQDTL